MIDAEGTALCLSRLRMEEVMRPPERRDTEWRAWRSVVVVVTALALSVSNALAQSASNGTIRGKVTDETSASMPGVTITVTSPALIVAQLVVTTDTEGNYSIPDLPIGDYRVSYEL